MKIKTSGKIIINYGLKDFKEISLPFQYGYDEQYLYESFKEIKEKLKINTKLFHLYQYCKENNIILRYNKQINCLKKELK